MVKGELLWTAETRALVLPRRRHGVREALPVDGAAGELLGSIYKLRAKGIVEGVAHAVGDAKELQEAVVAHFSNGAPLSEAAAAAVAMLLRSDHIGGLERKATDAVPAAL